MERQFCINWAALVEEAKQRRRTQKLTQARLAELAGVSTPTISHFECGKKDIQLSTVINILTVLGMNDQRHLVFVKKDERYERGRGVLFNGQDGSRVVQCVISEEALEDHFQCDGKNLMQVFRANRESIEHQARRKYLAGNSEKDDAILLKTSDFG